MSFKIPKSEMSSNYMRFGNIQIVFLQGKVTPGELKQIDFPMNFVDNSYTVTVNGDYGSNIYITNKYNGNIIVNARPNDGYNTGKFEVIAIGKWK